MACLEILDCLKSRWKNIFQVVGSDNYEDYYTAAIYNVASNTWTKLAKTTHLKQGSSLVSLSNRIFSIGGLTDHIEEFHPSNNSWVLIK